MLETGLHEAKILLPNTDDMTAFSIVACDQFTSELEYWKKLESQVKGKKTALDLVLPEIYLSETDKKVPIINENIDKYLSNGWFSELPKGFILTVRKTPYVERRIGLVATIDLEKYEYSKKSSALIRSTEGTIEERIPPRLKIRKNASCEFPHIMILCDDEKREIIEKLYENRDKLTKVYDFELNMGGGHIEGYFVEDYKPVLEAFSHLLDEDRLIKKYGSADKFAFAVGDGNHSLATAKTHWNNVKESLTAEEKETHPARFALAEIVNIYDEGIYFEPIFRFVNGIDKAKFLSGFKAVDGGKIGVYANEYAEIEEINGKNVLPQGILAVDEYIKNFITENGGEVDYIHGEKNLTDLVDKNENSVGIFFEKMDKNDLFRYVSQSGALPRKTFSMGENVEKRYYLEGRKIK